jgi:hypothetical protein
MRSSDEAAKRRLAGAEARTKPRSEAWPVPKLGRSRVAKPSRSRSSDEAAKRSLAGAEARTKPRSLARPEAEAGEPKSCEEPEAKCGTRGLHFRAKHALGAKLLGRRLRQATERDKAQLKRAQNAHEGERVPI